MKVISIILFVIFNDRLSCALYLNEDINSYIINGIEAIPNSFPWQCGLIVYSQPFHDLTVSSTCGGSILSRNFVLTSAFCLQGSEYTLVIAGAHRIFEIEETQQRFHVEKNSYIIHPEFIREFLHNDIALMKLGKSLIFNNFVQAIKLPSEKFSTYNFIGEKTQIAGWGRFSDWTGDASEVLRVTRNHVVDNEKCHERFGILTSNRTMCLETLQFQSSSCRGDQGSPVVWENENSDKVIIGVVSFGIWIFNFGCDPTGNLFIPTVNTNINYFIPWIRLYINN
ncbi:hypothetical protein PVAND_006682 [Polypedilum vanderplanki]|uniref:Peptidase S1 domain-containing protein n=1 Tax=Polypedilum vanderplanki TaxID=319348 RepID=A0A9J6C3Y1_POLVA|nr:hypothetical protein PVAND_006682 [Polypedilum vanderplanki]